MDAWAVGFFALVAVSSAEWWLTRHARQRAHQVVAALMRERRDAARELAGMLATIRPFLEDIARIDPEREESIRVGLLELDAHLKRAREVAEGDSRLRRLMHDKPLGEEGGA